MSKIRAVPFKAAHIDLIDIRERERIAFEKSPIKEERLQWLEDSHAAETILCGGIVLAIAGFIEVMPKTIELFLIPSIYVSKNTIAFARLMKYYKEKAIPQYDWHRLQIVTPNDDLHIRWAEFLGFEREGILRKFDYNGEDHIMWSIVR